MTYQEALDAFNEYLDSDRNDWVEFQTLKQNLLIALEKERKSMTNFEYERQIAKHQVEIEELKEALAKAKKGEKFMKAAVEELAENLADLLGMILANVDTPRMTSMKDGMNLAKAQIIRWKLSSSADTPEAKKKFSALEELLKMPSPKELPKDFDQAMKNFITFLDNGETNIRKFEFLRDQLFTAIERSVNDGKVPRVLLDAAHEAFNDIKTEEDLAGCGFAYKNRGSIFS